MVQTTTVIEQLEFKGVPLTRYKCSCGAVFYAKTEDAEVKSCGHERAKRDAGSFVVPPIAQRIENKKLPVDVRREAYQLWEQAGRPEGRADEFWLESERRLRNQIAQQHWVEAYDGVDLNIEIDERPDPEE